MIVSHATRKSHNYNEDRCVVTDRVFVAIDGATVLSGHTEPRKGTIASLLAASLKSEILRHKGRFDNEFFRSISKKFYAEGRIGSASAGLAGAVIEGERLHIFSLGDCEVILLMRDGECFRFKRTDLDRLDAMAIAELVKRAKERKASVLSSRPLIMDILKSNRAKKNSPGGYDVFEPLEEPTFTLFERDLPLRDVAGFYVCSDGFAQCFTTLGIFSSYRELFDTDMSVKDIIDKIKQVSYSDPECDRYPRFKVIDDITVIKAVL